MKKSILAGLLVGLLLAPSAWAKPGDAKKGLEIYNKRCVWCHGDKGEGDGPGAQRMNPPPRDFTSGLYKIKTSDFEDTVPNDEDIFRMVRDGMPGTFMPGWKELLNEQDLWDVVAQVKEFSTYTKEKPAKQVDYGTQIVSSPESIATGKKLFLDRCVECHGDEGKGDATKKLKGDTEERTWPRNLTKPWTFRDSSNPKDIFSRISVGIPGTQMPSFADPVSKRKLSVEERWHVANYVQSLAKTDKLVRAENTVVKSEKVTEEISSDPNHPSWEKTLPTTFYLVPQIIGKERFFTPSNDSITVRSVYNDKEVALLLEWDDRTQSLPGDETAKSIADAELTEDAVAVQLPITMPVGMEKPYFGMGDATHPVTIWQWKSGIKGGAQSVKLMNAKGFGDIKPREATSVNLTAAGRYTKGTWKVVMKRPLTSGDATQDLQFENGQFIPIAFAVWDGSNSEKGSKHTMTTWYWLLLRPAASHFPLFMAFLTVCLIGGGLFWWARSAEKNRA